MEEMNLKISSSPHVRSNSSTADIMFDVIAALIPTTIIGIYQFGWYAALLIAVCVATAVLSEFLYEKCMKKRITISDFSAAVTGFLLALNLPPKLPIWMAMLGSVFAIIVVKQLFGGLGQNFMNPALAARCFLLLAFSKYMTMFYCDGVATATPLAILKSGGEVSILNMFIGKTAGTIGEVSAAAILLGAVYLLIRKVISPKIPLIYIGTFTICIVIYAMIKDKRVIDFTLAHLCGGGLMLGAWFMATDYVTSPITPNGKILYAIMLGLLTFVLRIFGASAEGVSYAIIISNLFVPLIEKATVPKAFGAGADLKPDEKKAKKPKEHKAAETNADHTDDTPTKKQGMDAKGIVKAVAALFVITLFMGAALGIAYNVTKDPIDEVNEKAKTEAYKSAHPLVDSLEEIPYDDFYEQCNEQFKKLKFDDNVCEEFAVAYDAEGNTAGFLVTIKNSAGYGGDIRLVVGYDMEGSILGVSFLEINETVGLGMEAKDKKFLEQFTGGSKMDYFTYTKTGSESHDVIDAISGATITTSAVTDAVNAANLTMLFFGGEE